MSDNNAKMPASPCPFMGTVTVPVQQKKQKKTLEAGPDAPVTGFEITTWPCNPQCRLFIVVSKEEGRGDCAFKVMGNFFLMAFDVLKMAEDVIFDFGSKSGSIDPNDYEERKDEEEDEEDDDDGDETEPEPDPTPEPKENKIIPVESGV